MSISVECTSGVQGVAGTCNCLITLGIYNYTNSAIFKMFNVFFLDLGLMGEILNRGTVFKGAFPGMSKHSNYGIFLVLFVYLYEIYTLDMQSNSGKQVAVVVVDDLR